MASLRLLSGLNLQLEQNTELKASFTQHAVAALLSQPTLPRDEPQCWNKVLDGAAKHAFRSTEQQQQQVRGLDILAAAIQACEAADLLEHAGSWGTQLAEALRRCVARASANDEAARPFTAAAAAPLVQAACLAAAILFARLRQHMELPGMRRDVSSIIPKLLPQLLLVLQDSQLPCSCHVAGLQLLAALLGCVPTAARSAVGALDQALQQLVLQAATSTAGSSEAELQLQVLAQAAVCAALLAAVPGDAGSWSDVARKLLSSCHDVLDHLLLGVGGRALDPAYRSYLATPGEAHQAAAAPGSSWLHSLPWQQQQQQQQQQRAAGASSRRHTRAAQLVLGTCVSALQQLLQQPVAMCVPLPGYSLTLLASRLLLLDGAAAVAAGAVPGSSTMFQEVLVLQPELQLAGWQLLQQAMGATALEAQLQGVLLRLVRQALRAWQLSGPTQQPLPTRVRCCMYDTAARLLQLTGLGGVRALAAEVTGAAVLELYGQAAAGGGAAGGSGQGPAQQRPAKRSRPSGGPGVDQNGSAASGAAPEAAGSASSALATAASLPAQAAVLRLLQQLLQAGGQLLPAEVRSHIDAIVLHAAQTAAAAALLVQQQPAVADACAGSSGTSGSLAAVQVAGYRALLASLLVPCSSHRPPFLSQALLLFSQGRSSACPAVAATCQAAAVQLEALLHPRATPISAVWQNSGMDGVPRLVKPLMWRFVDPAAAAAPAAGDTRPAAAAAAAVGAAADEARPASAPSAAAAVPEPPAGSVVVMGYPAHPQPPAGHQQANQQQQQHGQHLQGVDGPTPAAATAAAAPLDQGGAHEAPSRSALVSALESAAEQQQQQHAADGQLQLPASAAASGAGAGAKPAVAQTVLQLPQAAAAAAGAGGKGSGGLKAWSGLTPGTAFAQESSDSEGPLPDLDSGGAASSDDEGDSS